METDFQSRDSRRAQGSPCSARQASDAAAIGDPGAPRANDPTDRGVRDRDDDLVDQVLHLLHRLREVAGKTTGEDLHARVPDRLMHNIKMSLKPAARFIGELLTAHAQAEVRRAMAIAEQAGIEIDEATAQRFETMLQGQPAP